MEKYKPYQHSGKMLKGLRMCCMLSQKELSRKLGISHSYCCEIERGMKFPISSFFIEKLESVLSLSKKNKRLLLEKLESEYKAHKKILGLNTFKPIKRKPEDVKKKKYKVTGTTEQCIDTIVFAKSEEDAIQKVHESKSAWDSDLMADLLD